MAVTPVADTHAKPLDLEARRRDGIQCLGLGMIDAL